MKTLNILSGKNLSLLLMQLIFGNTADAQIAPIPKRKILQMGIYGEGFKELRPSNSWENPNIGGFTIGLAFRYRLSNTLQVSTGLGASVSFYGFTKRDWDGRYYGGFAQSSKNYIGDERTETLIRLPINLQTNIYKQKIFVFGGFELFKSTSNIVTDTYQDVSINKVIKKAYNYGSSAMDIQFCTGVGWNFSSFSLESSLKFYTPMNGMKSVLSKDFFSPSLRLNWYFIN